MFITITRKLNAVKGDDRTVSEIRKFLGITRFDQYGITQIQVESYRGKADSYICKTTPEEHEELVAAFSDALANRSIYGLSGTFVFVPWNTAPDLFSGAVELCEDSKRDHFVKSTERRYRRC
jgi:hypothetical protein